MVTAARATTEAGGKDPLIQKGPEVPIPEITKPLSHYYLDRLKQLGRKIALIDAVSGETVSGAQLLARSVAVAMELRSRGVGPGDVVSVALDNCLDVVYIMQGTILSGATYSPFNPNLLVEDVRHLLQLVQPKVVLCVERAAANARDAAPQAQVVEVRADNPEYQNFLFRRSFEPFRVQASADLDRPLCIMFSSGTSGKPKGVALSHRNWHSFLRSADILLRQLVTAEDMARDVTALATTNTWLSGFLTMMLSVSQGNAMVIFRTPFSVDELMAGIQKHRITTMYLAPPMVAAIAKHPGVERYDTSSLRLVNFSGSNLSPALQAQLMQRIKCPVLRFYALTESLLIVFPGPKSLEKPGTCGKITINVQMKIIDNESGKSLGPNTEGEICVRSPMTTKGYYNNPQQTADTIDKEGWVHTGDVGYYDEDGYLFIVDRYKELMKYKAIHVAPADIENVLTAHEGVEDAAVVGIEHDEDQEHPVGFVVRAKGHDVSAEQLHQFLRDRLPVYKQLHGGIYFLDEIPRNFNSKIKRRELRVMARELRQEGKLLH
ncbi:hypothetical protein R5R35_009670 [Gryllus longicercus]|uniref:Luciferin 4-monooxygenase n=1 Tax=Gryllus longicercus TaxID=2509291 RepID=A0AAN9VG88_9ORTH